MLWFRRTKKSHKANGQQVITLEMATKLKEKDYNVVPGQNFVASAWQEIILRENVGETEQMETEQDSQTEEESQNEEEASEYEESPRKRLNTSLESVGVSPVNLHALPQHRRVNVAKDKLKSVMEKYEESMSTVFSLPVEKLKKNKVERDITSETMKKATELDNLYNALKGLLDLF